MNQTIIQEGSFTAGEYGEVVVVGQPMIREVFFDFYPKDVYGEPREAQHKEKGPPVSDRSQDGAESPPPRPEGAATTKATKQNAPSIEQVEEGRPQEVRVMGGRR